MTIVEELRSIPDCQASLRVIKLGNDAADEIEHLHGAVASLKGLLQEILDDMDRHEGHCDVGLYDRARAALPTR